MKRKALLLGYTGKDDNNYLEAVEKDLKAYKSFLKSPKGGLWEDNEIDPIMIDEDLENLPQKYIFYKNKCDFLYVVYSGHGYYENCQHLGINKDNYKLTDDYFKNWAPRQILVFDACAKLPCNESINEELIKSMNKHIIKTVTPSERTRIRAKYDNQILQCPEQSISLFAASPDEYANATSIESYYISELLREFNYVEEDINIIEAHKIATEEVIKRSLGEQHPYFEITPNNVTEFLPGAIDELF